MKPHDFKFPFIFFLIFMITMCVPPQDKSDAEFAKEKARLDSLRGVRCPRLMSSAAEYYWNFKFFWFHTISVSFL